MLGRDQRWSSRSAFVLECFALVSWIGCVANATTLTRITATVPTQLLEPVRIATAGKAERPELSSGILESIWVIVRDSDL